MKLFKYRSIDTGKLILQSQTLRASNFSTLNDPFDLSIDTLFPPSFGSSQEEVVTEMINALRSYESVIPGKHFSTQLRGMQQALKAMDLNEVEYFKRELLSQPIPFTSKSVQGILKVLQLHLQ